LHPPHFVEADRPSEVEAAARELHGWGRLQGWWGSAATEYDDLDPIGKDEFDAIVERVLMSAAAGRRGVPPEIISP
jgi:hypothetical protein